MESSFLVNICGDVGLLYLCCYVCYAWDYGMEQGFGDYEKLACGTAWNRNSGTFYILGLVSYYVIKNFMGFRY